MDWHTKVVVAFAAGWLAAIAVVLALLLDARSTEIERAERSAAGLAQIMEEQTARTFQATSLALTALADASLSAAMPPDDPAFRERMRQKLAELPYVRAIFIIGADGRILHDTDYPATPARRLDDREYFLVHRDNPAIERFVSAPVLSRAPGVGWFVSVTQRIGSGARFEGVVVAAIQPAYFEVLYGRMGRANDEGIALFHRDGALIARHPPGTSSVGADYRHLPLFSAGLARAPAGSYQVDGDLFPGRRIVSYRWLADLPLVVHVSYGERAVLSEWRRSALGAAIAMGALSALLFLGLARELLTRRRLLAQREQREQAERLEIMGRLTGGIAHDFGNVLGVISNSLHLMTAADPRHAPQALDMALRSLRRGREMIERLLTFASRRPIEVRPASLNLLVAEAHPLVEQALAAHIELVLQLAPNLPLALVDASQLEMALLNLVVNARDAMGDGGRIVLRTYADASGHPCLAVEDDGAGMTQEVRRRAMEPFFTTKGAKGTGLGLAQVYGFMRQIGGSMRIESRPGEGTQVHLCFAPAPVREAASATLV